MSSQSTVHSRELSGPGGPATSFYADFQGLAALRRDAKATSPDALAKVARQFESLFTQMMLKSMRAATPQDSLFGSEQQSFYQDMFDQQMAVQLSQGRGLGLADMLVRQLQRSGLVAESPPSSGQARAAGIDGANSQGRPAAATAQSLAPLNSSTTSSRAASSGEAWPPRTREDFVRQLRPAAEAAGAKLGVDADTLIAHAALETGWGRSVPVAANGACSFNLFGIKSGSGWNGPLVRAATLEFANGALVPQISSFRAYASPEECMEDYAALLSGSPRYAAALGTGDDVAAFAGALERAGYATDPHYAEKLVAVASSLKFAPQRPITADGDTG